MADAYIPSPYQGFAPPVMAPTANFDAQRIENRFGGPPIAFGQGIAALNALSPYLHAGAAPGPGGLPYNSPGRGNADALIEALHRMSGGTAAGLATPSGGQANAGLMQRDVQTLAPALQRHLMLQEPERLRMLLQLMLGGYGLAGQLYSMPVNLAARFQNMETAYRQARNQAAGGIPLFGGILGGSGKI